ncbi:hypothetical protein [Mangrovicoccus sp. HB161399]|uniref:hypothetical protein n=1 Tax=Mangrovicoccus sp. HB161399 TaxID=2720392 RepID=UPI0015576E07|nr:hypothetical protein [Mangrovicoccus sp. HB161399]
MPTGGTRGCHIHLGLHKTASTHLQAALASAGPELRAAGIAWIGPGPIRKGKTGILEAIDGTAAPGRARRWLRRLSQDCRLLAISEENILGTMEENFLGPCPGPYRRGQDRLAGLLSALDLGEVRLFLALRHPADYYASCYRFHLRQNPFLPWKAYSRQVRLADLRWQPLVAALAALPGVAGITVWRYEDYPACGPQILGALLGPGHPEVDLSGRANEGMDGAELRGLYRAHGLRPDFRGPGFRPFGPLQRLRADARHARDLEAVARTPGVTLIGPARHGT